jgi:hypothetical protein
MYDLDRQYGADLLSQLHALCPSHWIHLVEGPRFQNSSIHSSLIRQETFSLSLSYALPLNTTTRLWSLSLSLKHNYTHFKRSPPAISSAMLLE